MSELAIYDDFKHVVKGRKTVNDVYFPFLYLLSVESEGGRNQTL